ncbi:hypothetical protein [Paraburkholderia atlantica]|uniref:hypothetical protein n=1 Tax=Paraburkholderia atlantica TaxID=2654982 RepID=UPI0016085AFA|nr:hypothetical protein [Paraburkholderia atlantica]MBB5414053.1 hypothetical protein [Paraburkholderia atlantica]
MSDYALALRNLPTADILTLLDSKGAALERLERAYRTGWYEGEGERDQVKTEYTALCAEWNRRNTN